MKRVLCIWLPNWPIQRLVVARPELKGATILLHARWGSRGERVVACSATARDKGIEIGMPLPEATALLRQRRRRNPPSSQAPSPAAAVTRHMVLHLETYAPQQDHQELLRLAEWCEQFSPQVGLADADWLPTPRGMPPHLKRCESLLLDATGTGDWFGGEPRLVDQVIQRFADQGYGVLVAIADTMGVAWGVARFGYRIADCGLQIEGGDASAFSSIPDPQSTWFHLPVEALRLPADTVDLLHQLGVFQIQQLMRLPRKGLSSRLGPAVLQRLDQALGVTREVFTAHRPAPQFHAQYSLEYPTGQRTALEHVLQQLLEQLARQLTRQGRGAVQLEVRLACLDAPPEHAPEHASGKVLRLHLDLFRPLAEAEHFLELVQMQLQQTSLPGAVRQVDVRATRTARREPHQHEFFADAGRMRARDLALLIDRLGSRLGPDRILWPRLRATAQPERAYRLIPLTNRAAHTAAPSTASPVRQCEALGPNDRPLQLHTPPVPLDVLAVAPDGPPIRFHMQNRVHQVTRFWGPERIETGWWRGRMIRRDYYRVETPTGQRFWLFRHSNDGQWFLHGTFT
jgi:protein ImuB